MQKIQKIVLTIRESNGILNFVVEGNNEDNKRLQKKFEKTLKKLLTDAKHCDMITELLLRTTAYNKKNSQNGFKMNLDK